MSTQSNAATEEQKLTLNRKLPRPMYFSAEVDDQLEINSFTEDALIITNDGIKKKAVSFLKSITDRLPTVVDDYNSLLVEFTDKQQANSNAALDEIKTMTTTFNDFRYNAMQSGNSSTTISNGFAPPVRAMTKGMGRLDSKERRELFHKIFDKVAAIQYIATATELVMKECRSWIRVFLSYPSA